MRFEVFIVFLHIYSLHANGQGRTIMHKIRITNPNPKTNPKQGKYRNTGTKTLRNNRKHNYIIFIHGKVNRSNRSFDIEIYSF